MDRSKVRSVATSKTQAAKKLLDRARATIKSKIAVNRASAAIKARIMAKPKPTEQPAKPKAKAKAKPLPDDAPKPKVDTPKPSSSSSTGTGKKKGNSAYTSKVITNKKGKKQTVYVLKEKKAPAKKTRVTRGGVTAGMDDRYRPPSNDRAGPIRPLTYYGHDVGSRSRVRRD